MKRAVIYARYSSDSQTEQSIEGQLRVINKFALDNDYTITDTYIERAMTGTNDNRPAFQKMIADSSYHKFDYVLVYKLDRFARSKFDSAIHKRTLKNNGVKVISATEGIPDTPEGIILESMLEGYAEYYSAELSQKVKRGQYESLQKGTFLGGNMLYGYKSNNKIIEIEPDKAEVVRKIFTAYANGKTAFDIADMLKAEKIVNNKGRYFCPNSIMNLLKNKKYTGFFKYGDYEKKDYYPQIIDNNTFEIVQKRIEDNKRSPARMKAYNLYRLSGKLYCGYCKSLMTGESGTSKDGIIYNYYKCFGRKKHNGCEKKTVKKEELENLVVSLALRHILSEEKILDTIENIVEAHNSAISTTAELSILKQEKIQNQKYLDNILTALKNGIFSETTQQELIKLEKRKAEIEEEILIQEALQQNQLSKEKVLFYFKQFVDNELKEEEAKDSIINNLVYKVILYDNKIIVILKNKDKITEDLSLEELENLCSNLTQDSPPIENCTHPNEQLGCVFFYLHECFGIVMPFEKPKIENPSHLNYLHIKRDEHGNFCKK